MSKNQQQPRLLTKKTTYTIDYPEAIAFAEQQGDVYWTAKEIKVEDDIQDILTKMTPSEKHGVLTVLKLFTLYELKVGAEYWGSIIMKNFPRPADIQRMAKTFSFVELGIHAPFYDKINKALHLSTDEFYSSYVDDPVLKDRIDFIDECLASKDKLFSLGVFAMVEGAILYSSFAYLKHFQTQGKNLINKIVSGINFSVRDESIHHLAGSWLFRTLLEEYHMSEDEKAELFARISAAAIRIREHEHLIVDKIFEKGSITGITDLQMKNFVDSRIDVCLVELGMVKMFHVTYNPIAQYFYKSISGYIHHDFFVKTGREYNRNWTESAFNW